MDNTHVPYYFSWDKHDEGLLWKGFLWKQFKDCKWFKDQAGIQYWASNHLTVDRSSHQTVVSFRAQNTISCNTVHNLGMPSPLNRPSHWLLHMKKQPSASPHVFIIYHSYNMCTTNYVNNTSNYKGRQNLWPLTATHTDNYSTPPKKKKQKEKTNLWKKKCQLQKANIKPAQ